MLGAADLALLTGRLLHACPLAVAVPGRDLSIAVHVDDSIEICAAPYHAILGKSLGLMLWAWMRRTPGQKAFLIVVDSKSHVASMPCRTFIGVTPFP